MARENNTKIVLSTLKYKSAPSVDSYVDVPLSQTSKNITEYDRSCITDYDNFIKGKYSKLSGSHKYKTLKFHYDLKYKPTDMLYMLFRKDDILWHERRKVLGCHNKIKCKCIIDTEFKTSGKVEILYPKQEQNYVKCKNYEPWKMPAEVELDDKPDLIKENYGLERSIKTLS